MKSLVILTSAVIVSSCATVFRGSSEMISFTSNPSGADVRLSTGQFCITPCSLDVTRKGDIDVTMEKYGYKAHKTAIPATIDGGAVAGFTAFNFVMIPIVNDVVDYNTRANYSRKPNPFHLEMIAVDTLEEYPTLPAVESDVPVEAQQPPVVAVGDAVSADSASVTAASTAPDNTTAVE